MNEIGKKIIGNPDYYYSIAMNYFNEAKTDDEECKDLTAAKHSISYLLHHEFIVTPSIEICLKFFKKKDDIKSIGSYYLYIDDNEGFVDEFLILS